MRPRMLSLHVGVAAARQALESIDRKRCRDLDFGSRQCPDCFALMDPEIPKGSVDDSAMQECELCGNEVRLLTPNDESTSPRTTPAASDEASPATQARARWPGASTFKITIDRSGGAKLGISVDFGDDSAVLVESINEGLFKQWNDRNEEAEVRSGDYLVEVNGIYGNSKRIIDECAETKPLEIVVLPHA